MFLNIYIYIYTDISAYIKPMHDLFQKNQCMKLIKYKSYNKAECWVEWDRVSSSSEQ